MSIQAKKPITVAADDFMHDIVNLINNSGLPYFIIESILKDCIKEVHIASQQQLQMDKDQFMAMSKETAADTTS